jgi:hypothetical protein
VSLKTLHGEFEFAVQKYLMDGVSLSYLELTQSESSSLSRGLQEFCAYYSNQLSYSEVAALVERHCGARVMSSQAIWQLVQARALQLSETIERTTLQGLSEPPISVSRTIDLYDRTSAEVIVLDDAIGVKAQKPQRSRPSGSIVYALDASTDGHHRCCAAPDSSGSV